MAKKFKPRGTLLAALDIGSHKIACMIGRVIDDEGGIEVLGVGYQAARGIKGGVVVSIDEADSAIRQAVHSAENMAAEKTRGYPLRDVIVNVPGAQTKSENLSVDIEIAGQVIADNDLQRALVKAQEKVSSADRELIHTILVDCGVDGTKGIRNPKGMSGQNLEVDIHVVSADINPLQNMANCVESSHLDILALCSSSYASGLATLVDDEMDLGCTVIDMGAGVTSFSVFQQGAMIYSGAVPLGGWHITNDIAQGLGCSNSDAERLKTLYGSAVVTGSDDNELIDVPRLGQEAQDNPNHIPRSLLIGIIQPRVEEILEMIKSRLSDEPVAKSVGRRVVLTGGASQLPSLRDLTQTVLDKQVRLGRPIRISGLPDAASGPAFSTVSGLLSYIVSHEHEVPAEIMAKADSVSIFDRVKIWWKENW